MLSFKIQLQLTGAATAEMREIVQLTRTPPSRTVTSSGGQDSSGALGMRIRSNGTLAAVIVSTPARASTWPGAVTFPVVTVSRPSWEETLTPSQPLNDALVALWTRCRERNGNPYKFATARLETSPQGLVAHVFLEF